jgi:nucleoside-diphosphate-sugar epimerase
MKTVLITGGTGFLGKRLGLALKNDISSNTVWKK